MPQSTLVGGDGQAHITNDETHSPETWATVTAKEIFNIREVGKDRYMAAHALQLKIMQILQPHHHTMQLGERDKLKTLGGERLHHDFADAADPAQRAMDEIVAASKGTPFEAYCANPEWQSVAHGRIADHFATVMDIERSWHADRNPHDEHAKAFRAKRHGA